MKGHKDIESVQNGPWLGKAKANEIIVWINKDWTAKGLPAGFGDISFQEDDKGIKMVLNLNYVDLQGRDNETGECATYRLLGYKLPDPEDDA